MARNNVYDSPLDVSDGGYARFPGVELGGGKKISSAVHTTTNGRNVVTITYADGNVYRFDCIKNGDTLSDIREYWNGVSIYGGEQNGGA
jgi:hypothetical protein